jgi:para-aminobenzoate synthetase component 1
VPISPLARLGNRWATDLVDVTSDVSALDGTGRWAVAIPYEGEPVCARFGTWSTSDADARVGSWRGPSVDTWRSSMGEAA